MITVVEEFGRVQIDCPVETRTQIRARYSVSYKGRLVGMTFETADEAEKYVTIGISMGSDRADYGPIVSCDVVTATTPWKDVA